MKSSSATCFALNAALKTAAVLMACASLGMSADENGPIKSASPQSNDGVSQLQRRLDRGSVSLSYDNQHGYLKSVLRELGVPTDSQALVFSKTSFQASRISPANPRAIYFNDNLYVGWVPGGDVRRDCLD